MAFICRSLHSEAIAAGLQTPIQQSLAAASLTGQTVEVEGQGVTLRGVVDSEDAKVRAGRIAADQRGTYQVMNLLEVRAAAVTPAPPPVASLNCQADFASILKAEQPLFATGSSALSPSSYPLLDRIAKAAGQCPDAEFVVGGHTDSSGPLAINLDLSQTRAAAVVAYLSTKGLAAQRIEAQGFGPNQPVADNTSEAGMQKNRRIEIKVKGL